MTLTQATPRLGPGLNYQEADYFSQAPKHTLTPPLHNHRRYRNVVLFSYAVGPFLLCGLQKFLQRSSSLIASTQRL